MKTKIRFTLLIVLFSAIILSAQKGDYSQYTGYIDLGDFSAFEDSEMITEVLIEGHLIRMVAKMAKNSEPELSELLEGIKLVRVNAFEVGDSQFQELQDKVNRIDKDLMSRDWDRIVKTRSRYELANVYIKTEGDDKIVGLVVATAEKGGEAAFVNIVGEINLETIGRLGEKFDIPGLDHVTDED
ncbi:DUF4252 domain-containing protein [Bacteroidota bacterium]